MSEAKEQMEEAETAVQAAIEALSRVVVDRCPGWDDATAEKIRSREETLVSLIRVRRQL